MTQQNKINLIQIQNNTWLLSANLFNLMIKFCLSHPNIFYQNLPFGLKNACHSIHRTRARWRRWWRRASRTTISCTCACLRQPFVTSPSRFGRGGSPTRTLSWTRACRWTRARRCLWAVCHARLRLVSGKRDDLRNDWVKPSWWLSITFFTARWLL